MICALHFLFEFVHFLSMEENIRHLLSVLFRDVNGAGDGNFCPYHLQTRILLRISYSATSPIKLSGDGDKDSPIGDRVPDGSPITLFFFFNLKNPIFYFCFVLGCLLPAASLFGQKWKTLVKSQYFFFVPVNYSTLIHLMT